MMDFRGLERELQEFERGTWGTNDIAEINEKIRSEQWQEAQDALTGMDEEQAEWEGDE